MKIAHFTDDNIFLDNALLQFEESFPSQNFVFVKSKNNELSKIKTTKNVICVPALNDVNINDYNYLVFHSLGKVNSKFLNECKIDKQKVLWLLHGYEVYSLPDFKPESVYDTKTLNYFNLKDKLSKKIKNKIRPIAEIFIESDTKEIKRAMKKVDLFCVPYQEEYDFLSKKFNLKSNWLKFSYYPLDKIIQKDNSSIVGNNILIGNSASYSSNHLDIFDKLKSIKLNDNQKIICPLSYGDKEYAKEVIIIGEKMFGDNFMPLTNFIPLNEYNNLISTCSIAFMNHKRQQAFGTVLSMIYRGSNVFLNDSSTIYHFCKNNDINIFNIDDGIGSYSPLTQNQINSNRNRIDSLFNKKELTLKLKNNLISNL